MTNDESKKADDDENKLINEKNLKFNSLGYDYDLKYFHSYQPILKKEFLLAIELNDLEALDSAYKEARKLIEGETRGRPSNFICPETRKEIKAHTCAVMAYRDGTSYTDAWGTYYGSGAVKMPQCTPQESARHLIGYCAIDETTRRMVNAFRLDLLEYAKDAQSPKDPPKK